MSTMTRMTIRRLVPTILAVLATILLPAAALAGGEPAGSTPAPSTTANWRTVLAAPSVRQPTGLAIDLRGPATKPKWAYVADAATGRIVKFGTGGRELLSWAYDKTSTSDATAGLAVGGSGNVFVANPSAGTVSKFSPFGRLLDQWSGFGGPVGVTIDGKGDVFVAERDARQVTELSPSGKVLARWSPGKLYAPGGQSHPTGVARGPRNEIYVSTSCVLRVDCGIGIDTAPPGEIIDGLLEYFVGGSYPGHVMEMWFGLAHTATSTAQPPDKESEPFADIGAIVSDRRGWLYVAGTVWWRGGRPAKGVLAYTPFGYKWDTLYLPSQAPIRGIAVDANGTVYVSQGSRILAHRLGKRPSSPTG